MKAIRVTCPNCGASLRVAETAPTASCEYCGTASTVMRRTRVFERVVAPPTASTMPRAVQKHTKAWYVFAILLLVVPMLAIGAFVATSARTTRRAVNPVKTSEQPPTWQGTVNALVVDVKGRSEIVGRGRRIEAGDIIVLMALDLATGKTRWVGDVMGTYTDTYQGQLSLDGDHLLYASETGELRAYSTSAGKLLWKVQLDERIQYFCPSADPTTTVDAVGGDAVIRTIDRATGAVTHKRAAGKPTSSRGDVCPRLASDGVRPFENEKANFEPDGKLERQLGFFLDAVIVGPTGARIASGSRATGTRITMIAALDPVSTRTLEAIRAVGPERWRATATPDGLGAESAASTVAVGETEVCIGYYAKTYLITCWALADGKRLWSAEPPTSFEGMLIHGRSLIVTSSDLAIFDLDTGKLRWRGGRF